MDLTPITVQGTVDDPAAVVMVNGVVATVDAGGNFTASIPLVEGLNTLTATVRDTDNLAAGHTIQVTLDTIPPVDYTLGRPGNVTDTRNFNVGAGALTGLHHFHVVTTGLPAGVSFTPNTLSFFAATGDVSAPFTIAATAGATVGIHSFQAEYQFHDAAETTLATHTLQFTIEVLP